MRTFSLQLKLGLPDRSVETRVCKDCGQELPATEFYPIGRNFSSYCKTCHRVRSASRYAKRHQEIGRGSKVRRHGLTREQYDALLVQQGGVCAICRQSETRVHKTGTVWELSIDHDHSCCPGPYSCGHCVRGLLCNDCNDMIGKADESIPTLLAAADYLARTSTTSEFGATRLKEGATAP